MLNFMEPAYNVYLLFINFLTSTCTNSDLPVPAIQELNSSGTLVHLVAICPVDQPE